MQTDPSMKQTVQIGSMDKDDQHRCRACGSSDLWIFLELMDLPVHVGVQWSTRFAARACPRGDIRLAFCYTCGLISNVAFHPDRLNYRHSYDNSLDLSPLYRAYAQRAAEELIQNYDLHHTTVMEIGCGTGDFLRLLCTLGDNHGVGFDPSYDAAKNRNGKCADIEIVRDFYSSQYAHFHGKLICCRQVFEHIPHPREFVRILRDAIGQRTETVVYFEVPNAHYILRDLAVWTIIYEHCSYFSPAAIAHLFTSQGFAIRKLCESYGGQFVTLEAVPVHACDNPSFGQHQAAQATIAAITSFVAKYKDKIKQWHSFIDNIDKQRSRAVLWGAGARAVSFLNIIGVTDPIPYVVDINPRKAGKHLPGTGQQVVPPEFLQEYRPDIVIIMNDLYEDEIRDRIAKVGVDAECLCA